MTLPHRLAEYASPEGAQEYLEEYEKVHRKLSDKRERRLLESFFERMGTLESALDLPSGWGRYLGALRERAGCVVESDYSGEMLQLGAQLFPDTPVLGRTRASGSELPFADDAFDLVFSMRLNHHLADPGMRQRHVDEIFRVARRFAVFSYFDAASLKNRVRQARIRLGARKRRKNTLRRADVEQSARAAGFRLLAAPMLFAIGSGHRLVLAAHEG